MLGVCVDSQWHPNMLQLNLQLCIWHERCCHTYTRILFDSTLHVCSRCLHTEWLKSLDPQAISLYKIWFSFFSFQTQDSDSDLDYFVPSLYFPVNAFIINITLFPCHPAPISPDPTHFTLSFSLSQKLCILPTMAKPSVAAFSTSLIDLANPGNV